MEDLHHIPISDNIDHTDKASHRCSPSSQSNPPESIHHAPSPWPLTSSVWFHPELLLDQETHQTRGDEECGFTVCLQQGCGLDWTDLCILSGSSSLSRALNSLGPQMFSSTICSLQRTSCQWLTYRSVYRQRNAKHIYTLMQPVSITKINHLCINMWKRAK